MALPASSAFLFTSVLMPARIRRMIPYMARLAPAQSAVTLALIDAQVSSEIQSCLTR